MAVARYCSVQSHERSPNPGANASEFSAAWTWSPLSRYKRKLCSWCYIKGHRLRMCARHWGTWWSCKNWHAVLVCKYKRGLPWSLCWQWLNYKSGFAQGSSRASLWRWSFCNHEEHRAEVLCSSRLIEKKKISFTLTRLFATNLKSWFKAEQYVESFE